MNKYICLVLISSVLCACGGGGTQNGGGGNPPAVNLPGGDVSTMAASGTAVTLDVPIQPANFAFSGTLNATASDADGVFMSTVSVNTDGGNYTLSLSTSPTAPSGHHTGSVTIQLFSDSNCTVPQQVPSISVPFDISILSSVSPWPGDNLTTLSAWGGAPDWTTFQGNSAHTGYVPVTAKPKQFRTRWKMTAAMVRGQFYDLMNTLTTADGLFYVARNNMLYAYKELDGSMVWQYDFSSLTYPSVNPPAVSNGVVYIAAGQQSSTFMFAFNAADGSPIFKTPMTSQWENYLAPTIGPQGIYTNAGAYGGLYAFDTSGTQLFTSAMAQTSLWTPAVDATGVYTYTGGVMKVVDPGSGAVLHSISDPTFTNYVYEISGSPVLGATGSVFVANYVNSLLNGGAIGNTLTNFNLNTDSIAWQVAGVYPSTPAYAGGVLYVANENPVRLEARAEVDGALLWFWVPPQAGDTNFKSEVVLTNNLVFVSTNLATYAIDRTSHKTVWSYPLMGRLALSRNGILYIQGATVLTAINLK
jgi:hypothetical protein